MRFSIFQQKILALILVAAIVAPAGLLTQPKKAEAACGLDGGGGGGGTPETNPNIQGPVDTSGMIQTMRQTKPRLAIQRLTEDIPLAVSISNNIFKSGGGVSTLPQTSFDANAFTTGGHLAEGLPVIDPVLIALQQLAKAIQTIQCVASSITSSMTQSLVTKEFVLDPIAYALANIIIADMLKDIKRWAVTGFKGDPVFLTDPGKYFKNLADDMLGTFLNDLAGTNLCNLRWKPLINIALEIDLGYRQRAQCSFSSIQGTFEQFANDFSKGGWSSWIQLTTRPQNNPYGAYLLAADEVRRRIGTMPSGILPLKTLELSWGKGILSMTKCRVGANADGDCVDEGGNVDPFDTKITTPGNIIEDAINRADALPNERIVAADEINETIAAVMYGLLVRTFRDDNGYAGADWSNLSSQVNTSGSLASTRQSLMSFIDQFAASEAEYKRHKEESLAIIRGGESALSTLVACYNDQLNLNHQYQNEIWGRMTVIETVTNPFSGVSSTTIAAKIQDTLGIIAQQITPRITGFQNAIVSSNGFIADIGQIRASAANATDITAINNANTLFSGARARWHNEIAAAEAQNEVDSTRRAIDPVVTQANTDLAECRATRQTMERFISLHSLIPISTIPGVVHIRATIDGSPVTAATPFVISFAAPTLNNPNFTTNANANYPDSALGNYTVGYVSGAPAGVAFRSVTAAATQTLIGGHAITFTFNFTTSSYVAPVTGSLNIRATLNGVSWSGPLRVSYIAPAAAGTSDNNFSITTPFVTQTPIGSYTINYAGGGPAGATLADLNGAHAAVTQTLTTGSTLTYTFNFITP
ncbi:MAG: hypothetical protein HZC03_02260 [Candidatus Lloydbacteria bacterium]|nr:hypothetical protein [Candidatus Lloydbacteria bacterium]